jgi:hypothetical protein
MKHLKTYENNYESKYNVGDGVFIKFGFDIDTYGKIVKIESSIKYNSESFEPAAFKIYYFPIGNLKDNNTRDMVQKRYNYVRESQIIRKLSQEELEDCEFKDTTNNYNI